MSRPLTIGIDCSTAYLALAAVDDAGDLVAEVSTHVGREHAARLPLDLAAMLEKAGSRPADVVKIRVGIGPGSYTGIRVAIAAAKGLARALGAELAGVSSFVGLAAAALEPGASAVVTLDARRGNVYAQLCRCVEQPGGTETLGAAHGETTLLRRAPRVITVGEALKLPSEELPTRFPGIDVVAGEAPAAAALTVSSQPLAPRALYL